MAQKTATLPRPANPNSDQIFQEFLADQKRQLKRAAFSKYESVIDLFRSYLNGYAYEGLSSAESALFERHYNAKGEEITETSASSSGRIRSSKTSGASSDTL